MKGMEKELGMKVCVFRSKVEKWAVSVALLYQEIRFLFSSMYSRSSNSRTDVRKKELTLLKLLKLCLVVEFF